MSRSDPPTGARPGVGTGATELPDLPRWRRRLRRARLLAPVELRSRLSDFVADASQRLFGPAVGSPTPPAELRRAIARSSSREEYFKAGALAAAEILGILLRSGKSADPLERWLDFGCGSGRLSWILSSSGAASSLVGVDIDAAAIRWCTENLLGARFEVVGARPPTTLESGSFDIAFAASVFTHFPEDVQFEWLAELRRLLRPGGLLVASTHRPELVELRPELSARQREELERKGFLFDAGDAGFNDGAAFHARSYLERTWTGLGFELLRYEPIRLYRLQDLAIWRRTG